MSDANVAKIFAREYGLTTLFSADDLARTVEMSQTEIPEELRAYPAGWFTHEPYPIEWIDLTRLYSLIRLRKVCNILEFGCGFSTTVMAFALAQNEADFGTFFRKSLRRTSPFKLYVVDNLREFLELTAVRIGSELASYAEFNFSPARMTTFSNRVCTEYETLPNVCPDLIYLDGPDQHQILGEVNGISTRHNDRFPMACDILKMEHFLLPGTLIVADGRTANVRFLLANFQRDWRHEFDEVSDVHLLELIEEPLGKWNRRQIEFCLGADWRSKPLSPDLGMVPR